MKRPQKHSSSNRLEISFSHRNSRWLCHDQDHVSISESNMAAPSASIASASQMARSGKDKVALSSKGLIQKYHTLLRSNDLLNIKVDSSLM